MSVCAKCGHRYGTHDWPSRILEDPHRLVCQRIGCRCGEYRAPDSEQGG